MPGLAFLRQLTYNSFVAVENGCPNNVRGIPEVHPARVKAFQNRKTGKPLEVAD